MPLNLKHHCSNNWEQGKSTTSKRSASLISQGLVILYFPILFDVLTKQDDTGEYIKFWFFFFPSNLLRLWQLNFFYFFLKMAFCTITLIVAPLHETGPHSFPICLDFTKYFFNIFWPLTRRELLVRLCLH